MARSEVQHLEGWKPMSEGMTPEGFKDFEDLLKKIDETLAQHAKKIKEQKMNENKNNTDMVWFSMSPDMEFASTSPTEFFNAESSSANHINISPDLAQFMDQAGMLLYDALYMPFRSRTGRLTEFFSWIERARDRMERQDFSNEDRKFFADWCSTVADSLLTAQKKHGLWLTDDEEDLVICMDSGIFNDHNLDGGDE
jgi:hypothetical protein